MRSRPDRLGSGVAPVGTARGSLRVWLLVAAALHAGALAFITLGSPLTPAPPAPTPAAHQSALSWLELVLEDDASGRTSGPAASEGAPPNANPTRGAPSGAVAVGPRPAASSSASAREPTPHLSGSADASTAPSVAGGAPGDASVTSPEPSAAGESQAPSGPRLSLQDLGVGPGGHIAVAPRAAGPTKREVLNQRLAQSLRSGLAVHDQRLGLGPEGPVVAAVKAIVLASPSSPRTSGLLEIRTNAAGLVQYVGVLEATSDHDEWRRIADALKRSLATHPLRIPAQTGGVSMQVRVESRVQLPSGADPGLAIELFGQTLKEGAGDRSASIKLFSPEITVKEVEVPFTNGEATMPMIGFAPNVLVLAGDLSDIGAAAQRVVTARLVALDVHAATPSAPAR